MCDKRKNINKNNNNNKIGQTNNYFSRRPPHTKPKPTNGKNVKTNNKE